MDRRGRAAPRRAGKERSHMSKHPSNSIKSRLLRRGLAGILSLALLLSLIPSTVLTARAAGWEDQYIQTLVDWGVMRGDIGGNMAPTRSITRAEFVTMMNRAYGYKTMGGHPFTDVKLTSWYNDDIDIGYNIGYFKGTSPTTASPNDTLTREQAAVLLARNMMLQPTVGETLGFSDSRSLSEWSRGLVGAAAENGIISGYDDGSFQPFRDITRGEVAAMLVRAIGTPVQEAGDHALGNVYGNVTVNTAGVKLRDGVIAGNLYLTGGIDLGDVLLENVTVLGQIIVSGGGESNSSQSSVILRNVVADGMIVDSIGEQFVTIRAEGNTDIPTTTVRTNAYVDDSSLPGYGLSFIELDGEEGALYQLAGNIKNVTNLTPGSDLQIVQGVADKVTVDEKATGSSVLVDGDAQVGDLNLDTGTDVTGTGDIKNLNVSAPGSTVEQLPDNIVIRPGINADIAGGSMNSTQGAQSSSEPKLLAGYPAVRKIAPQSAELVFRVNKPGTIYWAVSSVADGSVSEADLMEPPVYGNKVLASGKISATAANTDYTAAVNKLTSGGSYYVTAMLVDGRDEHSPIKVTSFTTPDDSVPAFATGYPVMTLVTTEIAQVTVMTTKSCLLYYALLPKGAKAPTEAEFKSAAIPGNLGYGSQSVTKNVTIPINVNSVPLEEKTDYVLYLWLVDHDGAQKSKVTALPFTTLDETPPNVTYMNQIDQGPSSVKLEYTIDENPADLIWAIVTEGNHGQKQFMSFEWEEVPEPGDENRFTLDFKGDEASLIAAKARLVSGTGALASGVSKGSPLNISNAALAYARAKTSSFVVYYIAHDRATASANLSTQIKGIRVHTEDTIKPTAELRFTNPDNTEVTEQPQANADVRIIFSEGVKGTTAKDKDIFLNLYNDVKKTGEEAGNAPDDTDKQGAYNTARNALAKALDTYMKLYVGTPDGQHQEAVVRDQDNETTIGNDWVVDWRNAIVETLDDGSGRIQVRLPQVRFADGTADLASSALNLASGASYYFHLAGIFDLATPPNELDPSPCDLTFTTAFAKVQLSVTSQRPAIMGAASDRKDSHPLFTNNSTVTDKKPSDIKDTALYPNADKNDPARIDRSFRVQPLFAEENMDPNIYYDILIWSDTNMEITLYSRPYGSANTDWVREGSTIFRGVSQEKGGYVYRSLFYNIRGGEPYGELQKMTDREYAIHVDKLTQESDLSSDYGSWSGTVNMKVSVVAGWSDYDLDRITQINQNYQETFDRLIPTPLRSIGTPEDFPLEMTFTDTKPPEISNISIVDSDTSPVITMFLNAAGSINYVVFPLTELQYMDGGTLTSIPLGTQITEAMIKGTAGKYDIAGYNAPTSIRLPNVTTEAKISDITPIRGAQPVGGTVLDVPSADQVVDGFANTPGATKGRTPFVGKDMSARIQLNGLEANTIYILLAVPQGSTAESFPANAVAYRFTTSMPAPPVITLNGVSTDVTATVDRSSTLTARLLVQNQLNDSTILGQKLNANGNCVDAATLPTAYQNLTVLEALLQSVDRNDGNPGRNQQYPSVFDVFGSAAAKQTVEGLIRDGGGLGNTSVGQWGPKPVTVTGNEGSIGISFDTKNLYANTNYVCITMAQSASTGAYAFRAIYPLQVLNNQPPIITKIGDSLSIDKNGNVTGTITINFDRGLYRFEAGGNTPIPVTHDATTIGMVDDTFIGFGGLLTYDTDILDIPQKTPPNGPIAAIELKIKAPTTNKKFSITVPAGAFVSQWATPFETTKTVEVTIDDTGKTSAVIK